MKSETNKTAKNDKIYCCDICDFITTKKTDYRRHVLTVKHQKTTSITYEPQATPIYLHLCCNLCGKEYYNRTGLWRHKKQCNGEIVNTTEEYEPTSLIDLNDKDLVVLLIKQNAELIELVKTGTHNTVNNTNNHTNSHNKTFNLNFFLNETCKDAMNISDFVSLIKPNIQSLENTGKIGYVNGLSQLIINQLNELEVNLRPMHCSDLKREILYVKDNNSWTKENSDRPLLTSAIKNVAFENIKNINEWRKMNPDCCEPNSKKNSTYLNIVSNSMIGIDHEDGVRNMSKIISNIAKEITIEKVKI